MKIKKNTKVKTYTPVVRPSGLISVAGPGYLLTISSPVSGFDSRLDGRYKQIVLLPWTEAALANELNHEPTFAA